MSFTRSRVHGPSTSTLPSKIDQEDLTPLMLFHDALASSHGLDLDSANMVSMPPKRSVIPSAAGAVHWIRLYNIDVPNDSVAYYYAFK